MHVAAGKLADGSICVRSYNFKLIDDFLCKVAGLFALKEHGAALAVAAKHHVVDNVHIADKTHAKAVFGNK